MQHRWSLFLVLTLAGCYGKIDQKECLDCGLSKLAVNLTCRTLAPPPLLAEAVPAYPALPALAEPVVALRPPGGAAGGAWVYVLERAGHVVRFADRPDADAVEPVLDLSDVVDPMGDAGLVAGAFHPAFAENGQLFLSFTAHGGTVMRSRVARFTSNDGGATFDRDSELGLFDIDQQDPSRIHLNADMKFGPDGYLYLGFGDGGPQWDPYKRAQSLQELRGKILRVDVDHGHPYAIPVDNPFARGGGRPEIYAYGLRNPWRFAFDRATGELWAGDVGFDYWEEIDRIPPGGNMGWPLHEGNHCLNAGCSGEGLVPAVAEYGHGGVSAAVVGGTVYHGHALPALAGRYVFSDYSRGDVWALDANHQPELITKTGRRIVSFTEEPSGELLLLDLAGGQILRLGPAAPAPEAVATTLGGTGCFRADDLTQPVAGLVPYDVRVPFWSDGAVKRRFLALPEGQSATVRPDGVLDLPVGTVLAKEFFLDSRPVETRLLMKYRPGQWVGYSYAWNDAGTDADLVPGDVEQSRTFGKHSWSYPTRAACLGCHDSDRGLGLEVAQLDLQRPYLEAGVVAEQLPSWSTAGVLAGARPDETPLPALDGNAPLERRARAYLHVNCAFCHTVDGPTPVAMDLRFTTPLAETGLCISAPQEGDLGVEDARRLSPGAPGRSLLALRMRATGADHMPPLGPRQVDRAGLALVEAWIKSLRACP